MDKIEKIRREIERRRVINSGGDDSEFMRGVMACYTEVLAIFDTLQEESVSEDFEEAIKELSEKERLRKAEKESPFFSPKDFANGVRVGAKWQKAKDQETIELAEDHAMLAGMEKMREQMLKDAVDGFVIEDIEEGNGDFLLSADYLPASMGLKDKQKVKVIILKDEQL